MKKNVCLLALLVFASTAYAKSATQVVFVKGELKHTYTIDEKSIHFKNEYARETRRIISEQRSVDMKSELIAISWAAKEFNEKLKTKCKLYAEIKADDQIVPVCQKDKSNVNKMFSILNSYNDFFSAP